MTDGQRRLQLILRSIRSIQYELECLQESGHELSHIDADILHSAISRAEDALLNSEIRLENSRVTSHAT